VGVSPALRFTDAFGRHHAAQCASIFARSLSHVGFAQNLRKNGQKGSPPIWHKHIAD
jgi:hypothetical protein